MERDRNFWHIELYIPSTLKIDQVPFSPPMGQSIEMLEINELLATLSLEEKENGSIAHALEVRKALSSRNYHRLFRLYNSAPNMGGYLMDFFVERERVAACCIICKSYLPPLPSTPLNRIAS